MDTEMLVYSLLESTGPGSGRAIDEEDLEGMSARRLLLDDPSW